MTDWDALERIGTEARKLGKPLPEPDYDRLWTAAEKAVDGQTELLEFLLLYAPESRKPKAVTRT